MNDLITAYPLCWPAGWPRCQTPQSSKFKTGIVDARDGVRREIGLLGGRDLIISSNSAWWLPSSAVLLQNGEIAARQPRIDDTGVAVYFTLNGEQKCIPSDKWRLIEDNLHAVALMVGALRGLERWGTGEIISAAFQGFQALSAGTDGASWWRTLEVAANASEVEIEKAYRDLVKRHHPDAGGDAEAFRRITEAYQQARGRKTA